MLDINQINKLQQENKRLKEEIKEVKKYQYQQEYLDKEIAELKAENELLREENLEEQKQYAEVVSENVQKIRQLKQTLQEIKEIAESAMAKQQEYKKDFEQILDLITKAES